MGQGTGEHATRRHRAGIVVRVADRGVHALLQFRDESRFGVAEDFAVGMVGAALKARFVSGVGAEQLGGPVRETMPPKYGRQRAQDALLPVD